MVECERLVKARKRNMKLYPVYRMVGVDIVFLYATKMLFLTQVKGINAEDVIFSVSMYALFMVILQIPATMLIKKIGYIKSAFISNCFNVIYIILLMFSTNVWWLIFAEFTSAITFALKDVAEPSLLNISIPQAEVKGKIYSKLEGKGTARYKFFDGIANVIAGVVYVINPYLPMIFAIGCSMLACMLSLHFKEIEVTENENQTEETFKSYIVDMKSAISFIIKSKRLRLLLLYSGMMWGIACIVGEYKDAILVDIGTSSVIIGIIGTILGIASAIASKRQVEFHNKFRNKSFTYISISCAIGIIISGCVTILNLQYVLKLIIIVLTFIIIKADGLMYSILMNRYLANFSNPDILPKIYSVNSIMKNIIRMIFGIVGTMIMSQIGAPKAMFIVGIFSLVGFGILLKLMETRVGLKPEEYDKKEIEMKI